MTVEARKPNFLFLGPDRSGSVWLHNALGAHPQVFLPYSTDLFFFDQFFHLGEDWYLENFLRAKPSHHVVAEVSRSYLFSAEAADRIRWLLPGAKLMACLREPVDRAFSAWLELRNLGASQLSFSDAMESVDTLVDHGLYAKHLRSYYERFSRDSIYTPVFSYLARDADAFAQELFEFLGVDSFPLPSTLLEPMNPASEPRNLRVARLASWLARVTRKIGMPDPVTLMKSSRYIQKALYRPYTEGKKPTVSKDERERFKSLFRDDVHELAELTGVDVVDRWKY